ncbi:MAG: hypothetical protein ACW99V_07290 [Candidatus Thorarchaeota archaeon]|jgi:hypothetical protein
MLQLGIFDLTLGEIMAFFADPIIIGWVLIGSGILGAAWLLENITDPVPLLGTIFDGLVAISTYLGFFIGIVDILAGYVVWQTQPGAAIIAGVLILVGFASVMRVLSKFPIAGLFAAAVAIFLTFTIYGLLSPYANYAIVGDYITQFLTLKWMAVLAVIIFCVVYVLGGLVIKLIQLIGKVFSATPVIVLIGLAAIGLGVVLLVAPDMLNLIDPWPMPWSP